MNVLKIYAMFEGQVTLEIDALSLVLDNCDFYSTESNPVGYVNAPLEAVPNVTALPYGSVSINKIPTKLREFTMELTLSYQKALTLQAIILSFNNKIENKVANPQIKMIDEKIPLLEMNPRLRAKKGLDLVDLIVPTGFTRYYPIYGVSLSSPELESNFFTRDNNLITVTGNEIVLLPTSEDLP